LSYAATVAFPCGALVHPSAVSLILSPSKTTIFFGVGGFLGWFVGQERPATDKQRHRRHEQESLLHRFFL